MKNIALSIVFALTAPVFIATSAASAAPALSDVQIAALDKNIFEIGYEINPGTDLLGALALPPGPDAGGYGTIFRARSFTSDDKVEHSFARRSGQQDCLLILRSAADIKYLRADANLTIIAGAYYRRGDGTPTAIPPDQAADILAKEFAAWARWADQH